LRRCIQRGYFVSVKGSDNMTEQQNKCDHKWEEIEGPPPVDHETPVCTSDGSTDFIYAMGDGMEEAYNELYGLRKYRCKKCNLIRVCSEYDMYEAT
jgi:hypothetical protein